MTHANHRREVGVCLFSKKLTVGRRIVTVYPGVADLVNASRKGSAWDKCLCSGRKA